MKREGIRPCACCAVRMVYVVLTQRRTEEGRDRTMCMLCCTYGVCCVDTEKDCCAVRMVYVVLTQRRRSYMLYSGVPHVTTPIYTPHM